MVKAFRDGLGTARRRLGYAIMDQRPDMVALAQRQGIKAAYEPHTTPMDCPWPPELYEEVYAWLSGYSVGRLRRQEAERPVGR